MGKKDFFEIVHCPFEGELNCTIKASWIGCVADAT